MNRNRWSKKGTYYGHFLTYYGAITDLLRQSIGPVLLRSKLLNIAIGDKFF